MGDMMNDFDQLEQARFIYTTGRLIHERILRVHSRHLAARAGAIGSELSVAQLNMIAILSQQGPLSIGVLADQLGITAPSASAMVDRLVEKGVLLREHSSEDRRKVEVRISPEAVKEITAVEESLFRLFRGLVEKLDPETTRKWCEVLGAIQKVIMEDESYGSGMAG